eukprot:gnl/TRDRNA2_/TRDRNA2_186578_c0_seq1.p1 gnl/TRDRNA2_/TRDRNA2_186578_c0~~gnl/TRDRNA2_/TRDRNA2_186578_c0_seq1.p1  ORF type:complete len:292 (+),score=43.44 gnl/TRDRNA2_/TRDRNA2_186578_c0_seq1:116-991(+)
MGRLKPASACCGAASLLVGVEVIVTIAFLCQLSLISICSSMEPIKIANIVMKPWVQVMLATWAFIGIPITLAAGVGMLYRMEHHIQLFLWYLIISFFIELVVPVSFFLSGSVCEKTVPDEIIKMGSAFVCGFTDTFLFFWSLTIGVLHIYCVYIVWSASKELTVTSFPQLMQYSDALKSVTVPPPVSGQYPLSNKRGYAFPNAPHRDVMDARQFHGQGYGKPLGGTYGSLPYGAGVGRQPPRQQMQNDPMPDMPGMGGAHDYMRTMTGGHVPTTHPNMATIPSSMRTLPPS